MRCRPGGEDIAAAEAGAAHFKGEEVLIMPGFDGTGPMGEGPMTGGAKGFCNPSGRSYTWSGPGRGRGLRGGFGPGYGRGRGYGRGFGRRWAYPPGGGWYNPAYGPAYNRPYAMRPEDEMNMLKDEADYVKDELDAINRRISELESRSSGS